MVADSDDEPKRLRPTYATEDDALAAAQSEWQRLKRGGAEFSLDLADGRADFLPESLLAMSGFKPEIDILLWLVSKITHPLGGDG